jgi:hypothetical protein
MVQYVLFTAISHLLLYVPYTEDCLYKKVYISLNSVLYDCRGQSVWQRRSVYASGLDKWFSSFFMHWMLGLNPVAEFIDPWPGDKVNSGTGLSHRPANHVAWRAGTTTLYAGADSIPQSGYMNSATGLLRRLLHWLSDAVTTWLDLIHCGLELVIKFS